MTRLLLILLLVFVAQEELGQTGGFPVLRRGLSTLKYHQTNPIMKLSLSGLRESLYVLLPWKIPMPQRLRRFWAMAARLLPFFARGRYPSLA